MSAIASIASCGSDSHQMPLINTYAWVLVGEISGLSISGTDAQNGLSVMCESQLKRSQANSPFGEWVLKVPSLSTWYPASETGLTVAGYPPVRVQVLLHCIL